MGFSVAILAFAIEDGPTVLDRMNWTMTDHQVGLVAGEGIPWEQIVSPEFQKANDPHFSAATGRQHFFVYLSLKEASIPENAFYEKLSEIAPLLLQTTVETSSVTIVSRWEGGDQLWSVTGTTGDGVEIDGPALVDLTPLVR